ncbi:hypothetical protein ABFS83_02G127500 [Erythranthe nasuta]
MQHFSHPHQLHDVSTTVSVSHNKNLPCFGCKLPLSGGTCYGCSACNFYLHKFCFDHPRSAYFVDSHPKHTLGLLYPPYCQGAPCDACSEPCNGFTYNCTLCEFNVHANCAAFLHADPNNDRDRYASIFFKQKVSEIKTLKSQLDSFMKQKQESEEEEANALQMLREQELSRRRQNMYMVQIMNTAASMNALGRIG